MKSSPKIILIFLLCSLGVLAQQMPNYSQYMLNGFLINPALAGYDGYTVINLTSRQQWIGLKDAPRNYSLSTQGRILSRSYIVKKQKFLGKNKFKPSRSGRTGLGASIDSDIHGIFKRSSFNLSYAHHIAFPNAQLSFGLAFTGAQFAINTSSLSFRNKLDNTYLEGLAEPVFVPDFSTGTFFYNRTLTAGFSVSNLFESYIKIGSEKLRNYKLNRQYNFIFSNKFSRSEDFVFEPSVYLKTTEQLTFQFDLSARIYYLDQYWFGLSYRTVSTAVVLLGIQKNKFFAGYAFDYNFQTSQLSTFGSHEITAALRFGESVRRYRWMNRF